MACMWDLVPGSEIEPGPPELGARSLNHCATREVPVTRIFFQAVARFDAQASVATILHDYYPTNGD